MKLRPLKTRGDMRNFFGKFSHFLNDYRMAINNVTGANTLDMIAILCLILALKKIKMQR